jgi:hypothetical protein
LSTSGSASQGVAEDVRVRVAVILVVGVEDVVGRWVAVRERLGVAEVVSDSVSVGSGSSSAQRL